MAKKNGAKAEGKKKATKPEPGAGKATVAAVKHTKEARTNIPTREQSAMVAPEEAAPKSVLYPRDPSLDPQLVWKGKDELDRQPLEVPAVPIYIQEKIHPQAIIEDIRERAAAGTPREPELFSDFNGDTDPTKRTEFYQHDKHWTNRLILGDSLLVMTSLAEKERLKGRVQMIYLDPPYGIKFGSNWQVSTRKRDVKDSKGDDLTRQPEQIKAFRDTWQLGIHSYLTYLRDRLTVARELLTESGSIFVQIGDDNLHHVKELLDEVFGAENYCGIIPFRKTSSANSPVARVDVVASVADFLLWYGQNRKKLKYRQLYIRKDAAGVPSGQYTWVEYPGEAARPMKGDELDALETVQQRGGRLLAHGDLSSTGYSAALSMPFTFNGEKFLPPDSSHWKTTKEGLSRLAVAGRIIRIGNRLRYKRYLDDFPVYPITNLWLDTGVSGFGDQKVYVVQTNTKVIERSLLMTTDPGDLVLDPTCGSGTTAYVAEQWGRRWITTDTSRVALALARTRLMAARFPYYLLADSPEGRKKEVELTAVAPANGPTGRDIRQGFVYKRVPHVTLKSIANNPDIKEGMTREQIDAAIRRHADTEILYDQPYEDKSVVRVTGPFTVESLSPHRMLPTDAGGSGAKKAAAPAPPNGQSSSNFVTMILDNLRKAGVQNTKKGERLAFDRLDPYPGENLQAEGTYSENGITRRVAVCIGPEFGTVGPELLASAALEASKGVPFNLLLVCGFAFDPHVGENSIVIEKQFGRLRVLCVRMNPDLAMGDELLKKTGAGNLFMVFGEPDVGITRQKDGELVVEVRGVDIFDPTTGEIRSSSAEDIACWFIDTDYNDESFFVRHAYFLGGQEPYEKLKRALRAEIDEAEWSNLYSARSVPFDAPKKGKIAIKVINHYGDEVLKVYSVGKQMDLSGSAK